MASSSSSFENDNNEYDVFLSFRGQTRNNFTSHLYNALKAANINVFIDRSLEKGLELTPALHKVIDSAKISVVVFSSDYASSTFCLEELAKITECKESKGQTVLPIFYHVDPSNIRKLKETYGEAFAVHEANFKEEMKNVERWKSAVRKAGHLIGWYVDHTRDEAETIREIIQQISKKLDYEPTTNMKEKVHEVLKVGHDYLRNDKYRQCLLYCAMHPEGYSIDKNDLIEYCIADGVINELDSRQEEFDMGNKIIDELIGASLLEHEEYAVKMHDVVRDMVLTLTREKLMVKAGLQLENFPKFSERPSNLEGISIIRNGDLKRCSFKSAPPCYRLRILLMQHNAKLRELPNCFFDQMGNLTTLDMGYLKKLKLLPDSISKLKALRMLNLAGCDSLEYIPSLAMLKDLRHLNLSCANIKNLPDGLEKLVNLKLLHIAGAKALCALISSEVLEELSLLQDLILLGRNIEVDPDAIISLKNLEKLRVKFENFDALNSYLESRHWQRLGSYYIYNENKHGARIDGGTWCDKALLWCKDRPLDWDSATRKGDNTDFVIPFGVEQLFLMNWDTPLDGALINGCFAHLKDLTLRTCKLNYLIDVAFAKQLLQNLSFLKVCECRYIEEIVRTEEPLNQTNHKNYPTIKLPKLHGLYLASLPRLRSIYRGNMELPSLIEFKIDECERLERLPTRVVRNRFKGSNIESKLWWDSLQWDDQNHKQVYQIYIPELDALQKKR